MNLVFSAVQVWIKVSFAILLLISLLLLNSGLQIGPDMLISGFLQPIPDMSPVIPSEDETSAVDPMVTPYDASIIFFYKTWDPYGVFSNFSPHAISMPDENGEAQAWPSVEHYYQVKHLKSWFACFYDNKLWSFIA